jgi:hypothetical protein
MLLIHTRYSGKFCIDVVNFHIPNKEKRSLYIFRHKNQQKYLMGTFEHTWFSKVSILLDTIDNLFIMDRCMFDILDCSTLPLWEWYLICIWDSSFSMAHNTISTLNYIMNKFHHAINNIRNSIPCTE